ncbi:hypothetical protein U1Q18_025735 [Sarracenia purpurea var. burkii]
MGEKKSKNGGEKKKNDEQQQNKKNRSNEGSGKDNPPITVVFKVHMDCQCEGCAPRIKKCVRGYEGLCSPPRQIRQIRALFRFVYHLQSLYFVSMSISRCFVVIMIYEHTLAFDFLYIVLF